MGDRVPDQIGKFLDHARSGRAKKWRKRQFGQIGSMTREEQFALIEEARAARIGVRNGYHENERRGS